MLEESLVGGRTTPGVVRIGATVRRPSNSNSGFVRQLLEHLNRRGFEGAPRWMGTDTSGREIFSYIEGDVPTELGFHSDQVLSAAAVLIRRFHDISAELIDSGNTNDEVDEVICHNDLSPCNFVFRGGHPIAMIDFDAAAPGLRAHDLGYAAWLWLDIGAPGLSAMEQQRRLRGFIGAYGNMDHARVLRSMMQRQEHLIEIGRLKGQTAMSEWAATCLEWTQRHIPV